MLSQGLLITAANMGGVWCYECCMPIEVGNEKSVVVVSLMELSKESRDTVDGNNYPWMFMELQMRKLVPPPSSSRTS